MSFSSFNRILLLVLLLPVINACSPEKAASEIIPSTTANVVKEAKRQVAVKPSFILGQDFDIVREQASDTLQLTEHFSLYCIHCYNSEELFKALQEGISDKVAFNRMHALFLPQSKPQWGKNMTFAFAVAQRLSVEEAFIDKVFDANFVQQQYVGEIAEISTVFDSLGIKQKQLIEQLNDPKTLAIVKAMSAQAREDDVKFTPDLIVNNKYRVNLKALQGQENPTHHLIKLVNYLLTNP
ncbi:MAG: thioredoxin domain-containing protein [Psychrobium sp.]|nr:thioredoxin domain-containing protein [Psychrobium sp.]